MALSLTGNLDITPENVDALRKQLEATRSPTLDALREALPTIATSQLIGMLVVGGPPFEAEGKLTEEQSVQLVSAAILAISDEIDRRVPPK
jgi:hypothetical protein